MVKLKSLRIFSRILKIYFSIEYIIYAWFKYLIHKFKGGCVRTRLNLYQSIKDKNSLLEIKDLTKLAIFVAFHSSEDFPQSNKRYIEALSKSGFNIVYVHNGRLNKSIIMELYSVCDEVICRPNVGFDCGAWKDTYLWLEQIGILKGKDLKWLLFCNDSNFFLDKLQGNEFVSAFKEKLSIKNLDLIALTKNYDSAQHYQSFFLCISRNIFNSIKFNHFWSKYLPLNHRFHSVNNCEIKLSREILNNYSAAILYDSSKLYEAISKDKRILSEFFLSMLPKNAMYLSSCVNGDYIYEFELQRILAILDFHNPSHSFALLFIEYLNSPFLKKDIVRQGSFSIPQVKSTLLRKFSGLNDQLFVEEIIKSYISTGLNTSYIHSPRIAFRKGINSIEGVGFSGSGESLKNMGLR